MNTSKLLLAPGSRVRSNDPEDNGATGTVLDVYHWSTIPYARVQWDDGLVFSPTIEQIEPV